MSESRATPISDEFVMGEQQAGLERMYIEQYLRDKGHTLHSLRELPAEEARRLMVEASSHASAKLAEVEIRARFIEDIRGTAPPL